MYTFDFYGTRKKKVLDKEKFILYRKKGNNLNLDEVAYRNEQKVGFIHAFLFFFIYIGKSGRLK